MKSTTPNARFWHFTSRCNWVKLTVRPGQTLTTYSRWYNGEGYSWESDSYQIDGEYLLNTYGGGASDCDGRSRSGGELVCKLRELKSKKQWDGELMVPDWKKGDEWQRDYAAEAAGY